MIVGIDLGTTFSAIARMDDDNKPQIIPNLDGGRTTPSVVMFDGEEILVGEQAKLNSVTDPFNVCQFVKRQMGDPSFRFDSESGKVYSSEDISAMILKSLVTAAEETTDEKITGAVITVPAYFNDAQRKATQDAGAIAGINVMAVINEPTAAAIAYCHGGSNAGQQNVLVFDLGGGTFDVTIMSMNGTQVDILSTGGHKNLGGFDFDNEIISIIIDEFMDQHDIDLDDDENAMQDLRVRAEAAKKTLSTRSKATISLSSGGKTVKREITVDEFNQRIQGILRHAETIMEMTMEDSKLQFSDLDKIILVGGSTRIPAVQELITKMSGIKPSHDVHPDEAVALGAACFAASLDPNQAPQSSAPHITVNDVNAHTLGVVANNDEGVPVNTPIIPRNTKIPAQITRTLYTVHENQTKFLVKITEGEDEDLEYVTIIGESMVTFPPVPADTQIKIVMSYDVNGIVHVTVSNGDSGENWGEMEIVRKSNLSDNDIQKKIDAMKDLNIE